MVIISATFVFGKAASTPMDKSLYAGLTKYEAKLMRELDNLTDKQKLVLLHGYVTGQDTGYDVLPAIAWKESGFGKKVINSKDGYSGSFGVYQVQLKTAGGMLGIKVKKGNNVHPLKDTLTYDLDFNTYLAVEALKYWDKNGRSMSNILARYNGGGRGPSIKRAQAYAKDVLIRSKVVKLYIQRKPMVATIDVSNAYGKGKYVASLVKTGKYKGYFDIPKTGIAYASNTSIRLDRRLPRSDTKLNDASIKVVLRAKNIVKKKGKVKLNNNDIQGYDIAYDVAYDVTTRYV